MMEAENTVVEVIKQKSYAKRSSQKNRSQNPQSGERMVAREKNEKGVAQE